MSPRFIDTNILLRFAVRDDEVKAHKSGLLLTRLEQGTEKALTSPLVLFETIFTLQRTYKQPKERIVGLVSAILQLRSLQVAGGKQIWHQAFGVWLEHSIDFADAYNVASMRAEDVREVYTWDEGYDHVEGVTRVEPEGRVEEAA